MNWVALARCIRLTTIRERATRPVMRWSNIAECLAIELCYDDCYDRVSGSRWDRPTFVKLYNATATGAYQPYTLESVQ